MCEISPKIQCLHCLTYWTKDIVYCTCGICLRSTDKTRKLKRNRFDVLSIPNYVIKKGPSHDARHQNTERNKLITQFTSRSKRQIKRDTTKNWNDFRIVHFTEHHRPRLDGTENAAHATTHLQKKIIHTCLRHRSVKDVKIVGNCTQQSRKKRSDESTWRLRRSPKNQRAMVRRVWQQASAGSRHSQKASNKFARCELPLRAHVATWGDWSSESTPRVSKCGDGRD